MPTPNLDALALITDKEKNPIYGQDIPAGQEKYYHSAEDFNTVKGAILELEENSGGDFIPLTGTEEGKPVTGPIKFTNDETIYAIPNRPMEIQSFKSIFWNFRQ